MSPIVKLFAVSLGVSLFLLVFGVAAQGQGGIDHQDYGNPGSGGSTCTYCNYPSCACPKPPVGFRMVSLCGCSSIDCWRSCSLEEY